MTTWAIFNDHVHGEEVRSAFASLVGLPRQGVCVNRIKAVIEPSPGAGWALWKYTLRDGPGPLHAYPFDDDDEDLIDELIALVPQHSVRISARAELPQSWHNPPVPPSPPKGSARG